MVSFSDPAVLQNSEQEDRTTSPWVQGDGRGNHLKKGKSLVYPFLCDFYQNTEIRHTHKLAQKRSALFTAAAGTCPPGQPPAGTGERGQPHQQEEETRQEKTGGEAKGSREKPVMRRQKAGAERESREPCIPPPPSALQPQDSQQSQRKPVERKRENRGPIKHGSGERVALVVKMEQTPTHSATSP